MSKAIVLVAFGSANLQGVKNSIGLLEKDLNNYFGEDYTIVTAFTSNKIIDLLKERHDYVVPHLSKALFNLVNHGYEEVIIQPLNIMSSNDNLQIRQIVEEYKYSLKSIVISNNLFSCNKEQLKNESIEFSKIIYENLDEGEILLVGHGSKKNSNELYDVIERSVREVSGKKVYMATLESENTIDKAIEKLEEDKVKILNLKLLFIIPGKHVIDDILNDGDSWCEKVKSKGIEIKCDKQSLLQYKNIRDMYIRRINSVINDIK